MSTEKVIIVGAGIVGGCIARELSKYEGFQVTILEKEVDMACGTSKANTGIIHAGYDDDPEKTPVRAKLCAKGNMLWHKIAKQLDIDVSWCGALVCATDDSEIKVLESLYKRGLANGVPHLKVAFGQDARRLEPSLKGLVAALHAPTEGCILPFAATIAIIENAISNGVSLHLCTEVTGIEKASDGFKVKTNKGNFEADWVINAAGLYGDRVSHMLGISKTKQNIHIELHPRRGEYWVFPAEYPCPVNHLVFPVPTPVSKGIMIFPDPEGSTIIGPNAEDLPKSQKENKATTRNGLDKVYDYIVEKWGLILPPKSKCIKNYAGLRAESTHGDFIIEGYDNHPRFINVIGIRSPGLTSAPMIAKEVLEIMISQCFKAQEKVDWNPYRKSIQRALSLPLKNKTNLIKKDPKFSNLVCWCEGVSEGEIIEAIRRGARTVQGIGFRTRAGMGRCQGMSCQPKIVEIISRELKIPPERVLLKSEGSEILLCKIKDLTVTKDE